MLTVRPSKFPGTPSALSIATAAPYVHHARCSWCGYETNANGTCWHCDPKPLTPPEQTPVEAADPVSCPDASVHPDETYVLQSTGRLNRYDAGLETSYSSFRHSGWRSTRVRTAAALHEVYGPSNRYLRFNTCGANAHVYRNKKDPDRFQIRSETCHDRWCVPCSRTRARGLAATLADHIGKRQTRFITLTLKSSTEPLKGLLDKLLSCFRKLRRTTVWQSTQDGGAAFLEVKWNPQTSRWHPHLHIVSQGRYIPQHLLRMAWNQITVNSFIVDVRPINSRPGLCSYVTKYVSSPISHSVTNDPDLLVQAIKALHGRRTCTTYGCWRGLRLIHKPDGDDWRYYGSWADVQDRASINPWGEERRVLATILATRNALPWKDGPPSSQRGPPKKDAAAG